MPRLYSQRRSIASGAILLTLPLIGRSQAQNLAGLQCCSVKVSHGECNLAQAQFHRVTPVIRGSTIAYWQFSLRATPSLPQIPSQRMSTTMPDPALFSLLLMAAAALYAAVGHGGASAYLALMALTGFAPEEMRPLALVLNLFV